MIKFDHVDKVYANGTKALDDVNLEIEQGEFVAIIGLSGAGKSTLIRTINKMIEVTGGVVSVDGVDVSKLSGKALRRYRRKIGMVFQSFNLVNRTSVINNVLSARVADMGFFRTLFGLYSKEDKVKALEALDKVGILDKAYSRADQLSGGQQQRVALARTLAQDPEIILADEPTGDLDDENTELVFRCFRQAAEAHAAVLIVSHEADAMKFADRAFRMDGGVMTELT